MKSQKLETIDREEFDRRLDAYNERREKELQQTEAELTRVERLLIQYEQTLDEIEAQVRSEQNPRPMVTPA